MGLGFSLSSRSLVTEFCTLLDDCAAATAQVYYTVLPQGACNAELTTQPKSRTAATNRCHQWAQQQPAESQRQTQLAMPVWWHHIMSATIAVSVAGRAFWLKNFSTIESKLHARAATGLQEDKREGNKIA